MRARLVRRRAPHVAGPPPDLKIAPAAGRSHVWLRRPALFAGLLGCALLALRTPLAAQAPAPRAAVVPDTATVGDVVRAAIRFDLPPGARAAVPDSLALQPGVLENAGPRQVSETRRPDGSRQVTVVYPVRPWRPGPLPLPRVPIRIVGPDGQQALTATLPPVQVRSVLPADTTGIQPKPPSDVLGANRLLWPYILAGILLLLLLLLLAYWLWRRWRNRRKEPVEVPAETVSPREWAVRELDRIRAQKLAEMGEMKAFYSLSTAVVREYLAALDERWGVDLTTSELLAVLRETAGWGAAHELAPLLGAADMVKFARRRPGSEASLEEWAAMRRWVEAFPPATAPTPVPAGAPAEAA